MEDSDEDNSSEGLNPDSAPGFLGPQVTSSSSLSVARPDFLFGGPGGPGSPKDLPLGGPGPMGGPGMSPLLANILAASSASGGPASGSVKDAMMEMLKLFGFPPELAEVFAKNAQALQQQQAKDGPNMAAMAAAAAAAASAALAGGPDQGKLQLFLLLPLRLRYLILKKSELL